MLHYHLPHPFLADQDPCCFQIHMSIIANTYRFDWTLLVSSAEKALVGPTFAAAQSSQLSIFIVPAACPTGLSMPSSLAGSPPTADTRKRATTHTPETENFGRQRQARQERARLSRHSTVTSAKTGSHTGCSRMTTASRTSYATLPRHIRVPRPATAPEPPVVQRVSMRRLQATGHAGSPAF